MILLLINAFSEICRKIQNRKGIERYENVQFVEERSMNTVKIMDGVLKQVWAKSL